MRPFALLIVRSVTLKFFDHEDELKAAIQKLTCEHAVVLAFKFSPATHGYTQLEIKT